MREVIGWRRESLHPATVSMYYNSAAWQYNVYNPSGSGSVTSSHCYLAREPGSECTVLNNAAPHVDSNRQRTAQSWVTDSASACEECLLNYCVCLKVLNPANKKDFNMFTLRNLTAEGMSTPACLKEVIYDEVGDVVVSRKLDFPVGFYHKSAKSYMVKQ